MIKIFNTLKKYFKKYITAVVLFLAIFWLLFLVINLDFSKKAAPKNYAGDSFSGKLGEDFQKKIGATDVYQLAYNEWADFYALPASTNKYDDDPDGDGLPNYLEYVYGTNPMKADTDGDGFSDRAEITNGYDPDAPGDAKPKVDIEIKKMQIQVPMVWSQSEDENAMLEDLKSGVSHFPKTAAPGQNGNMVISGHSSNYVWVKGNYNYIFKDLNSLAVGDEVDVRTVQKNGRAIIYHYKINSFKKIVAPDDPVIFENTAEPTLTLSTCWPLGTNFRRLIVKADLVK
ncbi:MAG: sortase [Candidatus Moranbacteria bacterium]|nr:sortase [Candidatus Moranbacteria bacterium]